MQVHCLHPKCETVFEWPDTDTSRLVPCPSCQRPTRIAEPAAGGLAGAILGDYKLLRLVAKGGMGEVYEAIQVKLDRRVALKVLTDELAGNPSFLQRFEREAKAAAAINHPNVIQVYDFGHAQGRAFLVMEFVDGQDLSQIIGANGKLAVADALQIIEDVALALQEAHTRQIIHRDVKPGNILLSSRGQVKLSDLGLARRLDEVVELTATGVGIGSPHFMSPEQAGDARSVDHRADIYSLGITLLFLTTGTRPFDGPSSYAVVLAHASQPLPSGEDLGVPLPENVEEMIRRMAAKSPLDRYQTYAELLQDIQRARAGRELAPRAASTGDETLVMEGRRGPVQLARKPVVTRSREAVVAGEARPAAAVSRQNSKLPLIIVSALAVALVAVTGIVLVLANARTPTEAASAQPPLPEGRAVEPGQGWRPEPMAMRESPGGPRGTPPEPPSPLFPLTEIRNPLTDAPVETMWEEAGEYAKSNPANYREILARLDQVSLKAAGTPLDRDVQAAMAQWKARRDAALEEAIIRFTNETRLQERGMGTHSISVWSKFPDQLRSAEIDKRLWEEIILPEWRRLHFRRPDRRGP